MARMSLKQYDQLLPSYWLLREAFIMILMYYAHNMLEKKGYEQLIQACMQFKRTGYRLNIFGQDVQSD